MRSFGLKLIAPISILFMFACGESPRSPQVPPVVNNPENQRNQPDQNDNNRSNSLVAVKQNQNIIVFRHLRNVFGRPNISFILIENERFPIGTALAISVEDLYIQHVGRLESVNGTLITRLDTEAPTWTYDKSSKEYSHVLQNGKLHSKGWIPKNSAVGADPTYFESLPWLSTDYFFERSSKKDTFVIGRLESIKTQFPDAVVINSQKEDEMKKILEESYSLKTVQAVYNLIETSLNQEPKEIFKK